jgi:hypothetical protein
MRNLRVVAATLASFFLSAQIIGAQYAAITNPSSCLADKVTNA